MGWLIARSNYKKEANALVRCLGSGVVFAVIIFATMNLRDQRILLTAFQGCVNEWIYL
jgi:hypothetical protein